MERLWERFPRLIVAVYEDHKRMLGPDKNKAHDFYHAFATGNYGVMISDGGRSAELALVVGLLHNIDHLFGYGREIIMKKVCEYLRLERNEFSDAERNMIIEAILLHSGLNGPNDSYLLKILQDSDRLANIGPNLIIRASQNRFNLPPFNPRFVGQAASPQALAGEGLKTVVDDLQKCLRWQWKEEVCLRIPKARKIAEKWFKWLERYLEDLEAQLKEMGVLDLPEYFLP